MKTRAAALLFLAALLSGCGPQWTHPYIASPREEDKRFEADSAACRAEAETAGPAERERAFEACLTRLGWERKD